MAGIRGHGRVHIVWIKFRKNWTLAAPCMLIRWDFFTTLIAVCYIFSVLKKHCVITYGNTKPLDLFTSGSP